MTSVYSLLTFSILSLSLSGKFPPVGAASQQSVRERPYTTSQVASRAISLRVSDGREFYWLNEASMNLNGKVGVGVMRGRHKERLMLTLKPVSCCMVVDLRLYYWENAQWKWPGLNRGRRDWTEPPAYIFS